MARVLWQGHCPQLGHLELGTVASSCSSSWQHSGSWLKGQTREENPNPNLGHHHLLKDFSGDLALLESFSCICNFLG